MVEYKVKNMLDEKIRIPSPQGMIELQPKEERTFNTKDLKKMKPRTDNQTGNTYIAIDKKDTATTKQFFKCKQKLGKKTYLGTLRALMRYYLNHEKDINEEMTTEKKPNETHLCTNPNSYYYMTRINPNNKYEDCYMSIKCKSCAHKLTRNRK